MGGDHRIAVVDRTSRFIANKVGVDVGHGKGASPLENKASSDLVLTKSKMTRTRVQDDVDTAIGECRAGASHRPCILAYLEANRDSAYAVDQVAESITAPLLLGDDGSIGRPGLEPSWLVVDAVAGQVLLC